MALLWVPLPRYTSKAWYSAGHTGSPLGRNSPWARHRDVVAVSCFLLRNAATSPAFHQANLYTPFKAPAQVSCFQKPSFTFPERSHLSSFPLSTVPSTQPHWRTDHTTPSSCFTGLFSQRPGASLITGLSPSLRSQ